MLRQIVVPLDGSTFAETALPLARTVAREARANLTLIKVHEPTLAPVPAAALPAGSTGDLEVRSAEERYLMETARRLDPEERGDVGVEMIDGLAGTALTDWAGRTHPDLVVMATHGRGPVSRFWLGSVADHMIRHYPAPMLLVRPDGRQSGVPAPALRHGIVALDGSDAALAIIDPVGDLAVALDARLTLLAVLEPILGVESFPSYPMAVSEMSLESSRAETAEHLEAAAASLRARGLSVDTKLIVKLPVAGAILAELEREEVDFVAMTTHGAGGFKRVMLGSVADKVLRGATKPVLVVRRDE
jgi:nucleotide-binding universal stress UspA family protein